MNNDDKKREVSVKDEPCANSLSGRKILVVIDIQKDFVTGVLGSPEAEKAEQNIIDKIKNNMDEYGAFYFTKDVHYDNYAETLEGKGAIPKHCISGTDGVKFTKGISKCIYNLRKNHKYVKIIEKHTFGSNSLSDMLSCVTGNNDVIEIVGVCTDICVVSNALSLRQAMPNRIIKVDSKCCAGTNMVSHAAAIMTMQSCQIDVN